MNQTVERLQAKYAARFLMTAAAVVGAAFSTRLIWLGKTGDYLLPVTGIAIVCICVGWIGTRDLHRRGSEQAPGEQCSYSRQGITPAQKQQKPDEQQKRRAEKAEQESVSGAVS